jgi:hypothetical protein
MTVPSVWITTDRQTDRGRTDGIRTVVIQSKMFNPENCKPNSEPVQYYPLHNKNLSEINSNVNVIFLMGEQYFNISMNYFNGATKSMQPNRSWGAESRSDGEEIPRLLYIPKVHHRVQNSATLGPIRTSCIQSHTFRIYCFKIRFNISVSFHLTLGLTNSLPSDLGPKFCKSFSYPLCVLHFPFSFSLILSP